MQSPDAAVSIRLVLLKRLAQKIAVFPTQLAPVLASVFTPQVLLLLVDSDDAEIRCAAVFLLRTLLHVCGETLRGPFLQARGFPLLAGQLRQFSATGPLAAVCQSLLVGQPATGVPPEPWMAASVLALYEVSVASPALCLDLLAALQTVFLRSPNTRAGLYNAKLVPTLVAPVFGFCELFYNVCCGLGGLAGSVMWSRAQRTTSLLCTLSAIVLQMTCRLDNRGMTCRKIFLRPATTSCLRSGVLWFCRRANC
jgi:hypothetical protein